MSISHLTLSIKKMHTHWVLWCGQQCVIESPIGHNQKRSMTRSCSISFIQIPYQTAWLAAAARSSGRKCIIFALGVHINHFGGCRGSSIFRYWSSNDNGQSTEEQMWLPTCGYDTQRTNRPKKAYMIENSRNAGYIRDMGDTVNNAINGSTLKFHVSKRKAFRSPNKPREHKLSSHSLCIIWNFPTQTVSA